MASRLIFGGFQHDENEANLVNVAKWNTYSPRNKKLQTTVEWDIAGEIQDTTTAAIISRIQALEAAYTNDGSGATYSIDGAVAHQLSANSVSGVNVVRAAFPKGDAAELVNTRTFAIKLRAVYDAQTQPGGDDLVFFQESVSIEGNSGPLLVAVNVLAGAQTTGEPEVYQLAGRTAQFVTQSGTAVGYSTYPTPPPPILPGREQGHLRIMRRIGGRQVGNGIRFFTSKWSYRMIADIFSAGDGTNYSPTSK
jgi:hypothetical protein